MLFSLVPTLNDIIAAISGPVELIGDGARAAGALRHDSRAVLPGDLFVAMNGRDDHALHYLPQALERGAVAVILDDRSYVGTLEAHGVAAIVVRNARRAMAEVAHNLAGWPAHRLRVYGVTGTNGKTTTSWVLRQLLEACGSRTGVIGTLGAVIDGEPEPTGFTTPESPELVTILSRMVESGLESVAVEVSSHALALHRTGSLRFAGAVFTNLTQDHLDFHDSMEEYRDTKKRLFDTLDADAAAVVNIDDPTGEHMVRDTYASIYRYGADAGADARITSVALDATGSRWSLTLSDRLGGGSLDLATPLLGGFNVQNVTSALTLTIASGYDRERAVAAIETLRAVPGRMETYTLPGGATAVVDYAHTPDALESALRSLRSVMNGKGRLTVVFGCGGNRDRAKRPLMGTAAARGADRVIVTSDNPRSENPERIIDEVVEGIPPGISFGRESDRATAIVRALGGAAAGDVVLIAGKGHEDYQIIGRERHHFSDSELVRTWAEGQVGEGAA